MTSAASMTASSAINSVGDEHLSHEQAMQLLQPHLERLGSASGERLLLEPLGRLKPIADATTKFLVRSGRGEPRAVIICSRLASPGLMFRGAERAEAVRKILGERIGSAIIKPIETGYVGGRSFIILPWYRDVPTSRVKWARWRVMLRKPVLRWLREATSAAADFHGTGPEATASFDAALRHLNQQPFLGEDMRRAIEMSLDRLASNQWQPRHTIDHNDLYRSNLLLQPRRHPGSQPHWPFIIIDWAGANAQGYGIYDLLRMARSLKLSAKALGRELHHHAQALHCEDHDVRGHFLATCGWLHQHLEHFPEERFAATMSACWRTLQAGIEAGAPLRREGRRSVTRRAAVRRSIARPAQRWLESPRLNRAYCAVTGQRGAIILMYHSVAADAEAAWIDPKNHVPPEIFEEQVAFLAKHRDVIALDDLVSWLRAGRSPKPGSVVLTFDDGYLDNLTVAAPILDSLKLPATLFLPTAYIDRGFNQWIDEAYTCFQRRKQRLLPWGGDAGVTFDLDREDQHDAAYRAVCESLLVASLEEREAMLRALREALQPAATPPRLTMTWDDVRRLIAEHSCFSIGGHTDTHADMTKRSAAKAREELVRCRLRVEAETGSVPRHFSFPYGRFSTALRGSVMEAGFDSACGSLDDPLIGAHANCYAMRRVKAPRSAGRLVFLSSAANSGLLHRMGR